MNHSRLIACLSTGTALPALQSCGNDDKQVNVEMIEVAEASVTLNVGEAYTPSVTVLPENATDRTFTLTSSDETVASVDGETVTAAAVGTLDYYGTKIYGSSATAPHSEWTIYLGNKSFDFDEYEGEGNMLMLDIITAAEYTTEVPSGRYTVMYAADNAHFQPFMVVPGMGDVSMGNVLGTWYAPSYEPKNGANIGYADITNKGNGAYAIEFKFRDDTNETYFQGKFDGKLKYGDYHE